MSNCTTPVTHEDHNSRRGFPRRLSGQFTVVAPSAVRLSDLFADPFLRRAFRRAERDGGQNCTVPAPSPRPDLADGAVAVHELVMEVCQ